MKSLLGFDPRDFDEQTLSPEEILHWFDLCDAVWLHDGDPTKPHAELISGKCSNGYFDCGRVLCYPNISEILARQLVRKLKAEIPLRIQEVEGVIGSAYTAITLSYEVAKALDVIHWFVEKDPDDQKRMIWRRQTIPARSQVLQIEELITTAHTMEEVRRAVEEGNSELINFMPIVGALIHRPPALPVDYGDTKVVALIEKEVWAVDPSDCHLCQAGSPRYRPKSHWQELTGKK